MAFLLTIKVLLGLKLTVLLLVFSHLFLYRKYVAR
jgi:hypothetical protein